MANKDGIELTYDTKPFEKAMNKMSGSFDGFTTNMVKETKKTQKVTAKSGKAIGASFMKLSMIIGVVVAGVGLIKKAIQGIPEFGASFKIAGDIIQRNLLYPLRMFMLPYLQKMLDWVREHRTMFVKWGGIIVNVFKMIKVGFDILIKVLKSFTDGFKKVISDVFNLSIKNIMDLFNLAIFKITALLMILEAKISPITKAIGGLFATITKLFLDFVSSFIEGTLSVLEQFDVWNDVKTIFQDISSILKEFEPIMKPLGKLFGIVFGVTLLVPLRLIAATLRTIVNTIALMKKEITFKEFGERMKEDWFEKMLPKDFRAKVKSGEVELPKWLPNIKEEKVDDAIIKPDGTIIRTNPLDTIIATKSGVSAGGQSNVNFDMNINLNVTEGNSQIAGENFATSFGNKIQNLLTNQMVLQGG